MTIFDVFWHFQKIFFLGVISGNINPLGGLPGTNPGFLETQISAKSQGLKTSWSICFRKIKFVARSSNSVALTFRCGSGGNGPGTDCWEL